MGRRAVSCFLAGDTALRCHRSPGRSAARSPKVACPRGPCGRVCEAGASRARVFPSTASLELGNKERNLADGDVGVPGDGRGGRPALPADPAPSVTFALSDPSGVEEGSPGPERSAARGSARRPQPRRGARIPAQGATLGSNVVPALRSERTPHIAAWPTRARTIPMRRSFRTHLHARSINPGRCPGLVCVAPSGHETRHAPNPGNCPGLICVAPLGRGNLVGGRAAIPRLRCRLPGATFWRPFGATDVPPSPCLRDVR